MSDAAPDGTLSADDIRGALEDLATRLKDAGVSAGIRIVGGAALAIGYYDRPATRDVDALLYPPDEVKAHAREVGRLRGWPDDWLNDKVKMYMSNYEQATDWKVVADADGVTISVASAEQLLAMKLRSGRGRRDGEDIEVLLEICEVRSVAHAETIFERFFPEEEIKPRARTQVEDFFSAS